MQEAGVLDGGRADDDVGNAGVEVALDGVEIADAAADLDRHLVAHGIQDGLDGDFIAGLARDRAVQVDQVQAARALFEPAGGHGGGSSENTVASSRSPWRRRTQRPSLRSMAGISSMVAKEELNGLERQA